MRKYSAFVVTAVIILYSSHAWAGTTRLVYHGAVFPDYSTIGSAVNASSSGDEVHTAAGTFNEHVTMKTGVNLLGGYSASDWSRNSETNITVINAGGTGSAVTAATAILDGFTVKGCDAVVDHAGIYVNACSPVITHNKITQNARNGIYVYGNSSPVIENNLITSNSYYGIYCYSFGNGGVPLIYNNILDGNLRGINLYAFSPRIKNCIITNNSAYGIYAAVGSSPDEDYNDLWSNASGNYYGIPGGPHDKALDPLYAGGGDYHLQTTPVVSPCVDAGVDVGLPYYNLPDMGAYESSALQTNPLPPTGLMANPGSTRVRLDWLANKEINISGYKVSYGNAPGSYANTIDVGNVLTYDVASLVNDAAYFFAVRAYNTLSNLSDYSAEVSATPTAGTHELPHYNWDATYTAGSCTACHYTNTGPGVLLPAGYDYRYSSELCISCHNIAGQARAKAVTGGSGSHPLFVNASSGGGNMPIYGTYTGRYSNRMGDHLKDGKLIVCNTCHNSMEKTEDPGRTFEPTTFASQDAWFTYALQRGGWYLNYYLKPVVYKSPNPIATPTYIKGRALLRNPDTLSDYNPNAGTIKFRSAFNNYSVAYATVYFPYLRVDNSGNAMCLDCHNTGAHMDTNCLTCHENHNYKNRHGIRSEIKTPNSGIKAVVFLNVTGANSFADGDTTYNGVCEVCHTTTSYYRNDGTGFVNHSSGSSYKGKNCVTCHTHSSGFQK